jgi:hypothetical protein
LDKPENHMIETIEKEIEDLAHYAGRVPRWSFAVAVVSIGTLLSVLFVNLKIAPGWIGVVIVMALLLPWLLAVLNKHQTWTRRIAFTTITVLTIGLITSAVFLVSALFRHTENALGLFRDAILLWSTNIIVFAVWYWEVDQGGPLKRHANVPNAPDLLFPQMASSVDAWINWKPSFIDYLFVAFNTSTAFSPTDTLVMSTRAKILMMTQASISLVIVAIIAARAINIA